MPESIWISLRSLQNMKIRDDKKSVKQGMGISIISRLAAEEAKSGDLLTFPIPKADQGRDINLVYNKNYQMSKSAERFIKVVKEVYGIEE